MSQESGNLEDLTIRADSAELQQQYLEFSADRSITCLLDALPEAVLILNKHRQVVYINQATQEILGLSQREQANGLRPGELFQCTNSDQTPGGCGTAKVCEYCGANQAIRSSLLKKTEIKECRITRKNTGTAVDLRVKTAPFEYGGEPFVVFSILDISDEKRRDVLQRLFFHDIMNTVGILSGYSELLLEGSGEADEDLEEYKTIIFSLSQKLIDEITSQRQMIAAENGTLNVLHVDLKAVDVLHSVIETCRQMQEAVDKAIILDPESENVPFKSDVNLLSRVLSNLIKNGLEASDDGQEVLVGSRQVDQTIEFFVNNKSVMPDSVKYQVFQRSFSTKGSGRGLGTYSIKLLSETYLGGAVRFTSNETTGTTFYVSYPLH